MGASMKAPMLAKRDDARRDVAHDLVVDAHERARQGDVLAARQVGIEAGLEAQQRGDMAVGLNHALGGLDDAGQCQQERGLARAVGPDDADGLTSVHGQVHAAQRPEMTLLAPPWIEQRGKGRAQLRLLGQVQVVADAQVLGSQRHPARGHGHAQPERAGLGRLVLGLGDLRQRRFVHATVAAAVDGLFVRVLFVRVPFVGEAVVLEAVVIVAACGTAPVRRAIEAPARAVHRIFAKAGSRRLKMTVPMTRMTRPLARMAARSPRSGGVAAVQVRACPPSAVSVTPRFP